MSEAGDFFMHALLIGTGATMLMDVWAVFQKRLLGILPLDCGLVGHWLAYLAWGRFRHDPMTTSPPVRGECVVGWTAHYLIGIGSVAAPFLVMQPAMGAGIAASRSLHPAVARLRSLVTHGVFGVGLYAAACMARFLASGAGH